MFFIYWCNLLHTSFFFTKMYVPHLNPLLMFNFIISSGFVFHLLLISQSKISCVHSHKLHLGLSVESNKVGKILLGMFFLQLFYAGSHIQEIVRLISILYPSLTKFKNRSTSAIYIKIKHCSILLKFSYPFNMCCHCLSS